MCRPVSQLHRIKFGWSVGLRQPQLGKSLQRQLHFVVRQRDALRELRNGRGMIEQGKKFSLPNREPSSPDFFLVKRERGGAPQNCGIECRHACREVLLFGSTSLNARTTFVMPQMSCGQQRIRSAAMRRVAVLRLNLLSSTRCSQQICFVEQIRLHMHSPPVISFLTWASAYLGVARLLAKVDL